MNPVEVVRDCPAVADPRVILLEHRNAAEAAASDARYVGEADWVRLVCEALLGKCKLGSPDVRTEGASIVGHELEQAPLRHIFAPTRTWVDRLSRVMPFSIKLPACMPSPFRFRSLAT